MKVTRRLTILLNGQKRKTADLPQLIHPHTCRKNNRNFNDYRPIKDIDHPPIHLTLDLLHLCISSSINSYTRKNGQVTLGGVAKDRLIAHTHLACYLLQTSAQSHFDYLKFEQGLAPPDPWDTPENDMMALRSILGSQETKEQQYAPAPAAMPAPNSMPTPQYSSSPYQQHYHPMNNNNNNIYPPDGKSNQSKRI